MLRPMAAVIALTIMLAATSARGQNPDVLDGWYGSGVHAYFAGHTARAEQALTQAIEGGTTDPRAYYFRALTYLRMGRTGEAELDMATGAALEVRDRDGRYPISRSLERIQGPPRQVLERHRRQARSDAYQQQRVRQRERYETQRSREQEVLRQPVVVPLEQLAPAPGAGPAPKRSAPDLPPQPATADPAATQPAPAARPAVPAELVPPEPKPIEPSTAVPPAPAAPSPTPAEAPRGIQSVPAGEKVRAEQLGRILTRVLGRSLPVEVPPAGTTRDPFGTAPRAPAAEQADPFADIDQTPPRETATRTAPAAKAEQAPKGDAAPAKEPVAEDPAASEKDPFGETDSDPGNTKEDAAAGAEPAGEEEEDPFADEKR